MMSDPQFEPFPDEYINSQLPEDFQRWPKHLQERWKAAFHQRNAIGIDSIEREARYLLEQGSKGE